MTVLSNYCMQHSDVHRDCEAKFFAADEMSVNRITFFHMVSLQPKKKKKNGKRKMKRKKKKETQKERKMEDC